jgi:small-conductance mechanosensitive channel
LGAQDRLSTFDHFVLVANLLLLVFAGTFARWLSKTSDDRGQIRLHLIRGFSAVVLVMYLASMFTDLSTMLCQPESQDCDPLRRLSLTGLTILFSYAAYVVAHVWIVRRYGRTREIEGQSYAYQTYQSELFSLLVLLFIVVTAFLLVLSIWEVEQWLKGTSALGALVLVMFFTKDVWLPDNINGLILLYNNDIEPGAVIRVPGLDLEGVVLRTTLIQTTLRDLVQQHLILVPNAMLRQQKIEIISQCGSSGFRDFVEFNIGYDVAPEHVEELLRAAWQAACEAENGINPDSEPRIHMTDNADHAIRWRLMYAVRNVYRVHVARFAVQRAASRVALERGIGLNTPLTHAVDMAGAKAGIDHRAG